MSARPPTAPTDGAAKCIGDANANYVNDGGTSQGPGVADRLRRLTGAALATTDYVPRADSIPKTDRSRASGATITATAATVSSRASPISDGVHPSVVMCRGYYTRTVLAAWDWRNGKLTNRWTFDSNDPGNKPYAGQGQSQSHPSPTSTMTAKTKSSTAAARSTTTAKVLFSTGLGHGDSMHVSDLDPSNPGLEMFRIQERFRRRRRAHGRAQDRQGALAQAVGEGPPPPAATRVKAPAAASASTSIRATPAWKAGPPAPASKASGTPRARDRPDQAEQLQLRRLVGRRRAPRVARQEPHRQVELGEADDRSHPHRRRVHLQQRHQGDAVPVADILGDWREEVIWPTTDGKELRIYVSTIPTDRRFYTFMHDPQYRLAIAWQNVAYNQPPHTVFYVGQGMKPPPRPNIKLVETKSRRGTDMRTSCHPERTSYVAWAPRPAARRASGMN
jgi:rhamnogalacturonan endolyase